MYRYNDCIFNFSVQYNPLVQSIKKYCLNSVHAMNEFSQCENTSLSLVCKFKLLVMCSQWKLCLSYDGQGNKENHAFLLNKTQY